MSITEQENDEMKNVRKHICLGILAHVDAGKTTLSEALLYLCGTIRRAGRVDNGDAFLDTDELEKARGITIFSKQARMTYQDLDITLLDTPGHVDFSAEMERTLQVLDYAVLVISGADGVQGHTGTLWKLLKRYQIPVFLFVNKMDQDGVDRAALMAELQSRLHENCVDFSEGQTDLFMESVAMCDEAALEGYLQSGRIRTEEIARLIARRKLFPCFFGSALHIQGVDALLDGMADYTLPRIYPDQFGAKVFKIARDEKGNRLTHMRITGGRLRVREPVLPDEKVTQIRLYSGEKYETADEVGAGTVCTVTGLSGTRPGQGLGIEAGSMEPLLEPVMTSRIQFPPDCNPNEMLAKLKLLEEEDPALHIVWDEKLQEIQAQVMGEVQIEILKSMIWERFRIGVRFGAGNIVYKETIADTVEGVGHFEPLRHYAEVHLLLEPGEPGSGLQVASRCSEDLLDRNWQRLILTHLEEKEHRGVLTGSAVTDIRITLVSGRAHQKHTEGGDFRQATYRAVRQGLKEARSVLLEPYYQFRMEMPESYIGRAMTDIEKMHGSFDAPATEGGSAVLIGKAPAAAMSGYQKELVSYTRGTGKLFCTVSGYEPCHNAEEVIAAIGYDPERDTDNPTGSVFCAHGAGFPVPWDEVKNYMHLPAWIEKKEDRAGEERTDRARNNTVDEWIGTDEIDRILAQTYYANSGDKNTKRKKLSRAVVMDSVPGVRVRSGKQEERDPYLLVDGYNIIFAWEELRELAWENIDSARGKLLDLLCNYQGVRQCQVIAVFDAYRVQGHDTEYFDYHNIHVVFTREAETADQYIEKFAFENKKKYDVTVATSDGLEQIIIRGQGCRLLSATDLWEEITRTAGEAMEEYGNRQFHRNPRIMDALTPDQVRQLGELPDEKS